MESKKIALFGGGPACIIAAIFLSKKHEVHIYEKGNTIGRKFLVAGKGGFNLTNQSLIGNLDTAFLMHPILKKAVQRFDAVALQNWFLKMGIKTYVGTSGRVFPERGIKPIEVLEKLKAAMLTNGVKIHTNHTFIGFDKKIQPIVEYRNKNLPHSVKSVSIKANQYIFGLGGGSWKITGSNSEWLNYFKDIDIETKPFESSNCGLNCDFNPEFIQKFEGKPLKNIQISINDYKIKGEALITKYGLEGNAIYPIVPLVRKSLKNNSKTSIYIDLKPNNSTKELLQKITNKKIATKNYGYVFNLEKVQIQLLKNTLSKKDYLNPLSFAKQIKNVPVIIQSLRPVEEAISTVGGIVMSQINSSFNLIKQPHISIIGEMLDWDAPTGGFLLQTCFSSGYSVASSLD